MSKLVRKKSRSGQFQVRSRPPILGRFAVSRKGSFFGTTSLLITFSKDGVELLNLQKMESGREFFTMNEDISIALNSDLDNENNIVIAYNKSRSEVYCCGYPVELVSTFLKLKDFYIFGEKNLKKNLEI